MKCGMLTVLLMMSIACADPMTAMLSNNATLVGTNCRLQGGSTFYNVNVVIQNPSRTKIMSISYSYYNATSGLFEDGGRVCDVGIYTAQTCTFKVYTISGGINGTDMISFKLVGWVGDLCGENTYCAGSTEYDTVLSVMVNHYTGMYEQNIINKINAAMREYHAVSAQYNVSCYNESGLALLQSASYEISNASAMLSICDLVDALNTTNDAVNRIRQAQGYAKPTSCNTTTPQNNTNSTPVQPPQNNTTVNQNNTNKENNTSNVKPNQTQNNQPLQNLTNISSALVKGCIPFYILAAVLLTAVWSERRLNA